MKTIYDVKLLVKMILATIEEARDDDDRLYLEIIKCCHAENMTVEAFLTGRKAAGIPPFETVRRARQKAQAECPELRGKRTEERKEAEKVYFDFARS